MQCDRFELLTLLQCEGRGMERLSDRVGSPVMVTSLHWMRSAPYGLVLPIPPLPRRELKPHCTNNYFQNPLFNPNSQENAKKKKMRECLFFFFFWTMPCEWPLPFFFLHSYCSHTCLCHNYFHTTRHTKRHACTHMRSHEDVSCNGDGMTKTGLILALNIWCAERSFVCAFHQDVPHCLSLPLLPASQVRDCKETCFKK